MPQSVLPPELPEIALNIHHADVLGTEVISTPEGNWAIVAKVRPGAQTPIPEVENQASGFQVRYEADAGVKTIARPAYPQLGE